VIARRTFLAGTAAVLLAAPVAAEAQPKGKVWRIGYLSHAALSDPASAHFWEVFQRALQERGYVDGANVVFERRFAEGKEERYPALAAELVRLNVDVLVTTNGPAITAAKGATATIPIVTIGSDPVGRGLVNSLAKPGGNITGIANYSLDLTLKRLELLRVAVPKATRIVSLGDPGGGWDSSKLAARIKDNDAAAQATGVTLLRVELTASTAFDSATAAIARERPDALLLSPTTTNFLRRLEIAEFAIKRRLPSMASRREEAVSGILMTYGPSVDDIYAGAAIFVDKILKGAKPGDLPVEQPTKFELVINLKTAKALGVTIPPSVLGRADEIIQ
jgi:putative tryptophan/tyrosine transport system substrate-binding protein